MITSGSGMERFVYCLGSSVLPRALDANGNEHTTRGQELHAYLQRISEGMQPADSLDQVDEEFRSACAAVDLEQLKDVLGLSPEMTFAYNPVFGTSRVLGVALEREYVAAGLTVDEIPMTPDLIGLNDPTSPTIGVVVDYKSGFSKRTPAARNWQMRGGALALARHYDLDVVRVQLIHMRKGEVVYRDTATFTAADLAVFEADVRVRWDSIPGARDLYLQRGVVPEVVQGSWCGYCPSWHACPAKVQLVRAAVDSDLVARPLREGLAADDIPRLYKMLEAIEEPRKRLWAAIYATAKERPVLLETLEDGTQVWLGVWETIGNLKLDAGKARELAKELLGPDAAEEICAFTVSQDRIAAACKKRAPPRKGAEKFREFMAALEKKGGAVKPRKHDVEIYKLRPEQLAAKAG